MSQRKFFSIAAIIVLAIGVYFSIQLIGMGRIECIPYWNFECDLVAQVFCGGGGYIASMRYSFCEWTTCVGIFKLTCDDDLRVDYVECADENSPGCDGGW